MPMPPLPDLAAMSMDAVVAHVAAATPAPVEAWNPAHCGDSEMRIAADGRWYHQGSPIGRTEMVRKFATILRREADGSYVLVNPGERLTIAIDDAPFVATAMKADGGRIAFQTNVGDLVVAGPDHPIRVEAGSDGPRPYVRVRGGLDALIARPIYYELAAMAEAGDDGRAGVWSDGAFFALEPA
ncbi:DUF1285 domain-containing protein [Sphingomonas sp. RS2018]